MHCAARDAGPLLLSAILPPPPPLSETLLLKSVCLGRGFTSGLVGSVLSSAINKTISAPQHNNLDTLFVET